jgi:dipeptidyl-peptidase-3
VINLLKIKNFETYLKEFGFQTESTIIILMRKNPADFSESYFMILMKETKLAPSITAILFNEIDSKKVNLMSKGLLLFCNQFFMIKGLL